MGGRLSRKIPQQTAWNASEAWCAAHGGTMRNAFCGEGKWNDNRFTFATISHSPIPSSIS
jgi:heat shock protein HslJ